MEPGNCPRTTFFLFGPQVAAHLELFWRESFKNKDATNAPAVT
jgi:hypothetical protein